MKHKNIFIIGGTGFLGYYTSLELAERGASVTSLAMPDEAVDESLSSRVGIEWADIDQLSDDQLGELLTGNDAIIYAAGPDDRIALPVGVHAADFFGDKLVNRTERVLSVAKRVGIKKAVIFGSYFSYINNHGLGIVAKGQLERHPYIKARVEQTQRAFALGDDGFSVAVINIPYVFGTAPGKEPIWKHVFIDQYASQPKITYGNGGTTVITPKKIAIAAAQALELAEHGDELAVGSVDMKFKPMIEELLRAAKIDKQVTTIPTWLLGMFMRMNWHKMRKNNLDAGLDLRYLAGDVLGRDFYVDWRETDEKLAIDFRDDVDESIRETGELIGRML